ncbi:hypothetical protein S83_022429, partial [Arachis hypogaea]
EITELNKDNNSSPLSFSPDLKGQKLHKQPLKGSIRREALAAKKKKTAIASSITRIRSLRSSGLPYIRRLAQSGHRVTASLTKVNRKQYLKYPHWYCAVALDQAVSLEAFIDPPVYCRTWYTPKALPSSLAESSESPLVGVDHILTDHQTLMELADASGYALALMPSAKGLVPEHQPSPLHWNLQGPIFNDYCSVGYSHLLKKDKAIIVKPERVVI